MSGGGGGYGDGGGGGPDEVVPCLQLNERVQLASPVPEVVQQLQVHDILNVVLNEDQGVPVLQALTQDNSVAGSLTPRQLSRFLECMREGFSYVAVILEMDRGFVRVEIRPAPRQ